MKINITYGNKTIRKIQIINRDLWSLDTNLAHIIYKCLVKFRKNQGHNGQGYPMAFDTQVGSETYSEEQQKKDVHNWLSALDKMIYAFEAIKDDNWMAKDKEKEFWKIHDAVKKQYPKVSVCELWNQPELIKLKSKYDPIMKEHEDKIQEGLALFAQHFRSLQT